MALETSDIFPVQKTGGGTGSVRKATVGALLALAQTTSSFWQKAAGIIQPVEDDDNLMLPEGNLIVGEPIFGVSAPTNVGVEAHGTKGALHIRSQNNNDIAAFEILSAGSQLSHLKILGSGDMKIGGNVNNPADTNVELNPDGSAFFRGALEAESIDGGEYAT